jgi:hypothetical protein
MALHGPGVGYSEVILRLVETTERQRARHHVATLSWFSNGSRAGGSCGVSALWVPVFSACSFGT